MINHSKNENTVKLINNDNNMKIQRIKALFTLNDSHLQTAIVAFTLAFINELDLFPIILWIFLLEYFNMKYDLLILMTSYWCGYQCSLISTVTVSINLLFITAMICSQLKSIGTAISLILLGYYTETRCHSLYVILIHLNYLYYKNVKWNYHLIALIVYSIECRYVSHMSISKVMFLS